MDEKDIPVAPIRRQPEKEKERTLSPEQGERVMSKEEFAEATKEAIVAVEEGGTSAVAHVDNRIEQVSASSGLSEEKAAGIYEQGGFAARINAIKGKIAALTKSTTEKIAALRRTAHPSDESEQASEEIPHALTLDEYMATHKPEGLSAVKEKARLAKLRLKGIENPERVLGLVRYLEANGKDTDSKYKTVSKSKAEEAAKKWERQGFKVRTIELGAGNNKTELFGNREIPYHFDMRKAKETAALLESPNDPVYMFELLRETGYTPCRLDVTYDTENKLKLLLNNTAVPALLEKIQHATGAIGGERRYLFGTEVLWDSSSAVSRSDRLIELAELDAKENLINEDSLKKLTELSTVLGYPVSYGRIRDWLRVAEDPNLLEVLTVTKPADTTYYSHYEGSLLRDVQRLSEAGVIPVFAQLLHEGFDRQSFCARILEYGRSEIFSAKIDHLKSDPQFHSFVVGISSMLGRPPSLEEDSFGFFEKTFAYPEAATVFPLLIEYGAVTAEDWEYMQLQGYQWDTRFSNESRLHTIAEPEFRNFTAVIAEAGHIFELDDFVPASVSESWMVRAYRDEGFREAMKHEGAIEQAKYLHIFESPENYEHFKRFLATPSAMETLHLLEQNLDYHYVSKSDPDGQRLRAIVELVQNADTQVQLADPNNIDFIKSLGSRVDIRTVGALLGSDPAIRVVLETMVRECGYHVKTRGGQLADMQGLTLLAERPEVFGACRRLKSAGVERDPLADFQEISAVFDNDLFAIIEHYRDSPQTQEFIIGNAEKIAAIPREKVPVFIAIFHKIDDSPSQEIQRLKGQLISQLLESGRPEEDYQRIESIFIENNIPTIGKVYGVFETLYPAEELGKKIGAQSSPALQQASPRRRSAIMYQDLLNVHIESGNRSLKEYAEVLQSGEQILGRYEQSGLESLNGRERDQFAYFVGKLETLLSCSGLDTAGGAFRVDLTDIGERFNKVREGLKVAEGQGALDRISQMYLRPAGLTNLGELLEKMHSAKQSADQRGRHMVATAERDVEGSALVQLEAGDLLKGVDISYISNILQNGSVAKEFLGASSGSDMTPLDTDVSRILPEDIQGGFSNAVGASMAIGYGSLLFALKNRGQFQETTSDTPTRVEQGKWELFATGGGQHWGIRTGFPTTQIDFMVAREDMTSHPAQMEKLFFEIAQNGFYVPVADTGGKVVFTPELYDEYRKTFAGLDRFGGEPLAVNPLSSERIREIAGAIPEDSERVGEAALLIRTEVETALSSLGVHLRNEFDTGILGADLLDTGSTGRYTNTPGDFDFDFSLSLDAKDFPRAGELAQAIRAMLVIEKDDSHGEVGGYYQLRAKGVTAIAGRQLEKPLDIDIGFASKSDLSVYGTHDAIRDKLNYIRTHNSQKAYQQTVANIILAKQMLKEGHAYKKQEDGGFGGVGVENWILSNGGNLEQAFRSFRDAAYENERQLSYEEFTKKYKILDPGVNIKYRNHDNFIQILKPAGYAAMLGVIDTYFDRQK